MARKIAAMFRELNAVTFSTARMDRAVDFYVALGFELKYGGPEATFTSFRVGANHLNLEYSPDFRGADGWGRAIFHVEDVDEMYERAVSLGLKPGAPPRDAEWGERYFHLRDPDGHELSFARSL